MATKKNYQWLSQSQRINPSNPNPQFEFDESEMIWSTNHEVSSHEVKRLTTLRSLKRPIKKSSHIDQRPVTATSLPVNVPDWSKILGQEYKDRRVESEDGGEDGDREERGNRVPPHVYLARTRGASLSVHEGIGRTLKGRDLSRVRNAIWKKTGFED